MSGLSNARAIARVGWALAAAFVVALAPMRAGAQETPPTEADALDPLRERFRTGMEKYRAGAFAEAIVVWERIYGELGAEKGYRLAFNIARAYEQFGDPTRAAEFYEAYVKETASRHEAGEKLEPLLEKQVGEAKQRLAELAATQGRIRIGGDRAIVVRIDRGAERLARVGFIAYVAPGRTHSVTFNPGTKDEQTVEVTVALGEQKELSPPAPRVEIVAPIAPRPTRFETREERPFGKTVLYVAAGVTVASVIVPILFYVNADSIHDEFDAPGGTRLDKSVIGADYETARSNAYASLAIPAVLGAATIGLAAYWLFGVKETRVPINAGILPGGAAMGASARF